MQDLINGMVAGSDDKVAIAQEAAPEIFLPSSALRRLARLHARSEGATAAAQAAHDVAQRAHTALIEALNGACEDAGMHIPEGSMPVDLDWDTGRVRLRDP